MGSCPQSLVESVVDVSAGSRAEYFIQLLILGFESVVEGALIPELILNLQYLRFDIHLHLLLQ